MVRGRRKTGDIEYIVWVTTGAAGSGHRRTNQPVYILIRGPASPSELREHCALSDIRAAYCRHLGGSSLPASGGRSRALGPSVVRSLPLPSLPLSGVPPPLSASPHHCLCRGTSGTLESLPLTGAASVGVPPPPWDRPRCRPGHSRPRRRLRRAGRRAAAAATGPAGRR